MRISSPMQSKNIFTVLCLVCLVFVFKLVCVLLRKSKVHHPLVEVSRDDDGEGSDVDPEMITD